MATDWTSPKTSDTHTNELAATRGRDESNARMDYTGDTNIPDGTIRWNKTNNRFEIWNATTSTWSVLSSKYLINVDTVDGYHAGNASGNVPVSNGTVNTNLNADKLDGQHGTYFQDRANHTGTQAPSSISPQGEGSGLDADKLDGKHASYFQSMIDEKVDEFIIPISSSQVVWYKIGELDTDIGYGHNNLILLVSGVSDYGNNKPGVDMVQVSTRGGVSVDVYSLVPPGTRGQTYCYRNNATTGKTEIWVRRDTYTHETHFAVLNAVNATYGNLQESTGEPGNLVYVDIKTHWTSGNDGSGSGLDADLLDGQHASVFVTGPASSIDGEIALFNGTSGKALKNSGLTPGGYDFLPIGMPIPIWDHLSIAIPPNTGSGAIYIRLTAGQSGPGGYNQGLLRDETVSGSAPLVTATAVINLSDSPIYNQTVHLINTEEAFIRARTTSGVLQMDQMQRITGKLKNIRSRAFVGEGMVSIESGSSGEGTGDTATSPKNIVFDSANSPNARVSSTTSGETRSKNVSATWYLRIR